MFRKVLLTLEGVLADVSADVKIDELLPTLFLRRLTAEWPRRWITPPFSRGSRPGSPTRISLSFSCVFLRLPPEPVWKPPWRCWRGKDQRGRSRN